MPDDHARARITPRQSEPELAVDVYRAQGVLAERLGVSPQEAATILELEAATRALTVLDAARRLLQGDRGACGHPIPDPWGSC